MSMAHNVWYPVILAMFLLGSSLAKPRVQTKQGPMIGTASKMEDGNMVYSFKGIPYIKPPVGELRFKPPQPAEPWTGVFSATNDMAICPQQLFGPLMGTEDCIILNVLTPWDPSSSESKSLSVMVFFHGGGFLGGASGSLFGGFPDYLLRHNVILVTVNYRLGVLGFLSTGDAVAPGNYGLLDQVEALRWVKNNIASFGGNPEKVTIFGESAGSASAHYLMLSPLAKGLFHRVIAQSGTVLSPWASSRLAKSNAQALAKMVGCPEAPSHELIECLRKVDAEVLLKTDIIEPDQRFGMMPFVWSPRIDSEAEEPFLPEHPIELMLSGDYNKVPLFLGHTRTEGAFIMTYGKEMYKKTADIITNKWDIFCKLNLGTREFLVPEKTGTDMCNRIKEEYIDDSKTYEENKMSYAGLLGDSTFASGIYKTSELMSRHSPVYNYLFDYESEKASLFSLLIPGSKKVDGIVAHADDLMYIFKYAQTGWTKESPEYEMVEMMSEIWTTFAKTGEPATSKLGAPWPKANWPNHSYVVIDVQPFIKQNYRLDKMKMLEELFSNSLYKTEFNEKDEL